MLTSNLEIILLHFNSVAEKNVRVAFFLSFFYSNVGGDQHECDTDILNCQRNDLGNQQLFFIAFALSGSLNSKPISALSLNVAGFIAFFSPLLSTHNYYYYFFFFNFT